jgi:hypothetical protein
MRRILACAGMTWGGLRVCVTIFIFVLILAFLLKWVMPRINTNKKAQKVIEITK